MYKYLDVNISILRKKLSSKAIYIWIPAQVIRFPSCKPKDAYIIDCFFRSFIENPYLSIILLRKIPSKTNPLDIAPIDTKTLDSECKDVINDFRYIADEVVTKSYKRLHELIDSLYEYKDIEFVVKYFIRVKKYTIKGSHIREIDKRIAIQVTENLMNKLCLYNKKENKKLSTPITIEKYYVLVYIDPVLYVSGIAIGNKLIEIKTYLNLIKKLSLGHLFALQPLKP